jgi:hypothetical protein
MRTVLLPRKALASAMVKRRTTMQNARLTVEVDINEFVIWKLSGERIAPNKGNSLQRFEA